MEIYKYKKETGEFLHSRSARPDPLVKDRFLVPANSTTIEPPAVEQYEVAVFEAGKWSVKEDHRGREAWEKQTAEPVEIADIGPLPDAVTLADPSGVVCPMWDGAGWIGNKADALTEKLSKIDSLVGEFQADLFEFAGHKFYPDERSIEGHFVTLNMLPADYETKWKSADKEPDGVTNIYPTMTNTEFAQFAMTLKLRQKAMWDVGDGHKKQVKIIHNNPEKTAADIANHDISTGWQ